MIVSYLDIVKILFLTAALPIIRLHIVQLIHYRLKTLSSAHDI